MRYDLTDFEWSVIEPILPKGRRGQQPQNNRRVMNGIFWVLRTGAPWRDLPERYGPYTTAYNRFNRWRKAAIWDGLMAAVTKAHGGKVQMIDSSIVRVHQHAKKEWRSLCGAKPRRALDQNPCARRPPRPTDPDPDHTWSSPRSNRRRPPSGQPRPRHNHYRRQGL